MAKRKRKNPGFVALMLDIAERLDLWGRDEKDNFVYHDREKPRVSFMVKDDQSLYSGPPRPPASVGVATVHLEPDGIVVVDREPHMNTRNLKLHDPDFIDQLVSSLKACVKKRHIAIIEDRVAHHQEELDKAIGFEYYLRGVLKREV